MALVAPSVLVLQHSEIDVPGHFGDSMDAQGVAWQALDMHEAPALPLATDYDALLVMGGPQQVDEEALYPWLADEKALIRDAAARAVPVLGVCLGCQLIADALGGRVAPLARPEVGIMPFTLTAAGGTDPLFAGLPETPLTMQWHLNAVVDLPPGATHLARSEACAVQAFRVGDAVYGVQFHMEVTRDLVARTSLFPDYVEALEATEGDGAFARVVAATGAHGETLRAQAHRLFGNFLALVQQP